MKHILKADQFERDWLENKLFLLSDKMEKKVQKGGSDDLQGKMMVTLFYEASTRTRASFQCAMELLNGKVMFATDNAGEFSSVTKGETLEDTISVFDQYGADFVVLRHPENGASERAAEVAKKSSIINAGDGNGEHPTQALLDIYTIYKEIGKVDGIKIAMVGDLKNGRTVRSLCYLLGKFQDIQIYFVSPKKLQMRQDIIKYLKKSGVKTEVSDNIKKVAPKVDVIYQTRLQLEREKNHKKLRVELKKDRGDYDITEKVLELMKKETIIMHPLPRNNEIQKEVDKDPRAAYFRQAGNGLFVRMALLKMLLE